LEIAELPEIVELREAVKGLPFRFAKTMPEVPHWYIMRSPEIEAVYVRLFHAIHQHGYTGTFRGRKNKYLELGDGFKYWAMTTNLAISKIINRDIPVKPEDFAKPEGGDAAA
jgi:hypothetical protein